MNTDLNNIIRRLNVEAEQHPIGMLQRIRVDLKGLKHRPGTTIFSTRRTEKPWAFHNGGLSELQFNIAWEGAEFRHGVAFSLQRVREVQDPVQVLRPKIARFNTFMRLHANSYRDMRLWYHENGRGPDSPAGPIPQDLVREGVFIFFGKRGSGRIDYDGVLDDFDRLLPLYRFVEGSESRGASLKAPSRFVFVPGYSSRASLTTAKQTAGHRDVSLTQNRLQTVLCKQLAAKYGQKNVGDEQQCSVGTRVDVVVRHKQGYWFYEIKTGSSARACLREAIGQLLEYALWPPSKAVARLIVVGKAGIDVDGKEYLRSLNARFPIPIEYKQVSE